MFFRGKPTLLCVLVGLLSAFAASSVDAAQEATRTDTAAASPADMACGNCGSTDSLGCLSAPGCAGESFYLGNGNRFWGSGEFLLWSIKQGHVPPLATTGTLASGGVRGPGTTTLFGGDQDYDARLGGRFTIGYWLDSCQTKGIEASYFFLNGPSNDFSASSSARLAQWSWLVHSLMSSPTCRTANWLLSPASSAAACGSPLTASFREPN